MMRFLCRSIKGVITFTLIIATTLIVALSILISFGLSYLLPLRTMRNGLRKNFLYRLPAWYMLWCKTILRISTRNKWDIQGCDNLKLDGSYLMISNHQSWIDILVLGAVFNDKIPPLKFFMKTELLWQLPLAGLACYALGYPFVARHSHAEIRKNPKLKGKDIETTIKACERLKQHPSTLINFIEGTRLTPEKYKRQNSPFKYLLKPRAGGVSIALQALQNSLDGIINVTILYPGKKPTMWDFVSGNFKKVVVRYELIPITPNLIGDYQNDRNFRSSFQQWLNTIWQKDDELLGELVKQYE